MNMLPTLRLIPVCGAIAMGFSVSTSASELVCGQIRFAHPAIIPGERVAFDVHFTNTTSREVKIPRFPEGLRTGALQVDIIDPGGKVMRKIADQYSAEKPSDYAPVKPGEELVLKGIDTEKLGVFNPVQAGEYTVCVRARSAVSMTGQVTVITVSDDKIKKSVSVALKSTQWTNPGDQARVDLIAIRGETWLFYRILNGRETKLAVRLAKVAQDGDFIVSSDARLAEVAFVKPTGGIKKMQIEIEDGSCEQTDDK